MKASTLCDNQSHDDVTVSIAAEIVLRKLTNPPNADEDRRIDSSSSQLVPLRRSTWETYSFQQLITWANDHIWTTKKPSRTSSQWRRLIVAFRRSPAKNVISGQRQPTDDRPSRSRRADSFEAVEDFVNWYVGTLCWSNGKITQTPAIRHITISQVLGCISKGRRRHHLDKTSMQ